jgi:hypothetical protein
MPRGKLDPDWKDVVASWKQTKETLLQKMLIQPLDPLPRYVAAAVSPPTCPSPSTSRA